MPRFNRVIVFELILIVLFGFLFLHEHYLNEPSRSEQHKLQAENQDLINQNQTLQARINYLSLKENIEKEIKDKLALGQNGEEYIIIESTSPTTTPPVTTWFDDLISKLNKLFK